MSRGKGSVSFPEMAVGCPVIGNVHWYPLNQQKGAGGGVGMQLGQLGELSNLSPSEFTDPLTNLIENIKKELVTNFNVKCNIW